MARRSPGRKECVCNLQQRWRPPRCVVPPFIPHLEHGPPSRWAGRLSPHKPRAAQVHRAPLRTRKKGDRVARLAFGPGPPRDSLQLSRHVPILQDRTCDARNGLDGSMQHRVCRCMCKDGGCSRRPLPHPEGRACETRVRDLDRAMPSFWWFSGRFHPSRRPLMGKELRCDDTGIFSNR